VRRAIGETASRQGALAALDHVVDDLGKRLEIATYLRTVIANGADLPDVASIVTLPQAPMPGVRAWAVRAGSQADKVVKLLEEAGHRGMSEPELVVALQQQGVLINVQNPKASIHWTLHNLRRRSGALVRETSGVWKLIGPVARRPQSVDGPLATN
jgi:hypothetical protein